MLLIHRISFRRHIRIVVAMFTEIVKMLHMFVLRATPVLIFILILFCLFAVIPVVEVYAAKSICPGNAGVGVLNFSLRLWDILSASETYGGFHILS